MEILHGVDILKPYLLGCHFKIKTDHHCLKYFLEQLLSSSEQHKWVTKMLGYDYEIVYKNKKQNVIEDCLSQKYEDEGSLLSLSTAIPDWLNQALQDCLQDPSTAQLIHSIQTNPYPPQGYSWMDHTLKYRGCLVLLPTSTLKTPSLQDLHSSTIAGHSQFQRTYACAYRSIDGGKNPSQQRETLPVPQVPIRLMNIWSGRLDGIMDPLPF